MPRTNFKMKKYILFSLVISSLLIACQPEEETSLMKLEKERDAFVTQIDSINELLKVVEGQIAEKDTTKKPPLVDVMSLSAQSFNHYFKVQGNVEAEKSATLYPETQGLIRSIKVKEGQRVSAGQTLMVLDNEIVAKNIVEVETNLNLAKDIFERQERLWNQNIGSELQYLEAKNRKESLENTIATLRKQQSMAIVKAPFTGVVDQIYPKVGEMGSPMTPAMKIVNLSKLSAKADVSEKYLSKVKNGSLVTVSFGEGLDTIQGKVSRIGSSINPANRTFEITVDFIEKSEFLRPNLMAEIEINDFSVDEAIVVPSSYLLQDIEGNSFVYSVDNTQGKPIARKKVIETGMAYKGITHVRNGLSGSETIITEGARKLVDGKEIRLEE